MTPRHDATPGVGASPASGPSAGAVTPPSPGPAGAPLSAPSTVWQMYRAMVGIGVLCGLLIVVVYQWTLPIIEKNKAEALQRAVFEVLPMARSSISFVYLADGRFTRLADGEGVGSDVTSTSGSGNPIGGVPVAPSQGISGTTAAVIEGAGEIVHAGYDEHHHLVGVAIEAAGMGYQDMIHILYGYAPAADAVVGFQVLESKETPGLGDKIATSDAFLQNFQSLDVRLDAQGVAVQNPVTFVKPGEKRNAWEVDGITGATISSRAVAQILRESTRLWIPRLEAQLPVLENAATQRTAS